MVDVDHFKLVNDTYGHLQGDDVLVEVAEILRRNLRGYDVAARYGGDEFALVAVDAGEEMAFEMATRALALHPLVDSITTARAILATQLEQLPELRRVFAH